MIGYHIQLTVIMLFGALTIPVTAAMASFPERINLESHTLQRIGIGTARYAGFISVYEAAFYAPSTITRANVLDVGVPKRLEIVYNRSIERKQLIKAAEHALKRQHDTGTLDRWRDAIDRLHASYRDVSAGDMFVLATAPDQGLLLEFNGLEVARIDEPEFARLYFGIWLGDPPLSASLREALLPAGCCLSD